MSSGFTRGEYVQIFANDREIGPTDGLIELDEDLSCPNMIAVMHIKLADNAASRMLNLFDIRIDHHGAWRDNGATDLGGGGPAAKSKKQNSRSNTTV